MIDMSASSSDADRRTAILDAGLDAFSAYGFAKTSMADIATRARMSRPALYQYFGNKEDILVAVLVRVLGDAADRALAALDGPGDLADQLDAFLQRWFGDLLAELRASAHGIDLIEIKTGRAKGEVDAINERVRQAVAAKFGATGAAHLDDVLLLAPAGFKADDPPLTRYRRRLTALARSVAAAVS